MNKEILENFERAFSTHSAGCRRECDCGKIYYHDDENAYDWDIGEFEALQKNPKATALDYCPADMTFEGKDLVNSCTCWHEKAEKIINFLNSHGRGISTFFKLEKERKLQEAKNSPTIE